MSMSADVAQPLYESWLDGETLMGSGGEFVLLNNHYPPDQLWLPLGSVFVFRKEFPPPAPMPHGGAMDTRLYHCTKGVDQYPLVFPDRRRLSREDHSAFSSNDYPGWDRQDNGHIFEFRMLGSTNVAEGLEFLEANASGLYYLRGITIRVQKMVDAAMLRLRCPDAILVGPRVKIKPTE